MIVDVPVVGKVGDPITSFFSDFGKLEGTISDTVSGAFLLELEMCRTMREQLAQKLTWLEKKLKDPNTPELRADSRIIPANPHSTLTFSDGATYGCFVIDMSATGAAVSADIQPPIGTPLAVGACVGRVVRHLCSGFAIKFAEQQDRSQLEKLVTLPVAPPVSAQVGSRPSEVDLWQESA
jgi:hypothetical protein